MARHRRDAGEDFALLEQPHLLLVGRDLFAAGLEEKFLVALVCLRHRTVVEPMRQFVLVHDRFGVRKQQPAVAHANKPLATIAAGPRMASSGAK